MNREYEKGERGKRGQQRNKVDLVVEKRNGSEVSDYYYIIY